MKLRAIALAAALVSLLASGGANAQSQEQPYYGAKSSTGPCGSGSPPAGCQPVDVAHPLPTVPSYAGAGGIVVPTSTINPFPTSNISPESQTSLSFVNGQPFSLFVDDFGAGTLNTSSRWNRSITGGGGNATAATNAVGQTTIGTGTTANGWAVLISQRTIWDRNPGYNFYQGNINIPIPSVTHAYMLFGFVSFPFTAGVPSPTLATPAQNAAAFEFGANGKLSAVTFASGTRQLVADLSVAQTNAPVQGATAGTYTGGCGCTPQIQAPKGGSGTLTDSYKYVIVFRGDNILYYIEQPAGNLGLVAYTTRGAVGLDVNQVTTGYLALADATGPASTATMQINQVTIGDTAKNPEPGFDRSVFPQQALTAVNDAVGVSGMGSGTCTFTTVSNTNVTLVFEATDPNGTTWNAVTAFPWGGGAGVTTVSGTNGAWTVPCAGMHQVRMRVSAIGATPTVLATAEASVGGSTKGMVLDAASPGIVALGPAAASASVPMTVGPPLFGSYCVGINSGTMAAGLAGGSPVYSFRYGGASLAIIRKVEMEADDISTAFVAGAGKIDLFAARSFTASDTGGTSATLTGNNGKLRTSFATTAVSNLQVANTGTLSAGTRTLDAQPLATVEFPISTAIDAALLPTTSIYRSNVGESPFVLATNEGFVIQATVPGTGTWVMSVRVCWDEVSAL